MARVRLMDISVARGEISAAADKPVVLYNIPARTGRNMEPETVERLARLGSVVAIKEAAGSLDQVSDILARSVEQSDPRRKDIAEILKATERAAALTRQLLAFSKRQIIRPEILNPEKHVKNLARMMGRLIGEHIELIATLARRHSAFQIAPCYVLRYCLQQAQPSQWANTECCTTRQPGQ